MSNADCKLLKRYLQQETTYEEKLLCYTCRKKKCENCEMLTKKRLEVLLAGDSAYTAYLFAPKITINDMLLRNIVVVRQRCKEIIQMLPNATISLVWI